jgi:hypothetical protein
MMRHSRKRAKGQERKAKAASQANSWWTRIALLGEQQGGLQCNHGCPRIPAPDHDVTIFLNDLKQLETAHRKKFNIIVDVFNRHQQVWDSEEYRQMTIDILLAMGTNLVLAGNHYRLVKKKEEGGDSGRGFLVYPQRNFAYVILLLYSYKSGTGNLDAAKYIAAATVRDLFHGEEKEVIRFFTKRIRCSCLQAKYEIAKKLPSVGRCHGCKGKSKRKTLMLCGCCRIAQYCSYECQASHWPVHKAECRRAKEFLRGCGGSCCDNTGLASLDLNK